MAEDLLGTNTIIWEIEALLDYYSFETKEVSYQRLIDQWLDQYSANWIRLAIIEALYLGRYKAASVEPILINWAKKGHCHFRFNHDFETLICRNLRRRFIGTNLNDLESSGDKFFQTKEFPFPKLLTKLKAVAEINFE